MSHLAFCGFDCKTCPVYQATKSGDQELLKKLADQYQLPKEDLVCSGCSSLEFNEKLCGFCKLRPCAMGRGVISCAHCLCYPCEQVNKAIPVGSEGRKRLDLIYKSLNNN